MEPVPSKPHRKRPGVAEPWHLKKDLSTLLSVMLDISSELNLDELLHKIISHAAELCDADAGVIVLISKTGAVTKRYPFKVPEVVAKAKVPPGKGALGEAAKKKGTVVVNSYPNYMQRIESFAASGIKTVLATPITRAGRVTGVMEVFNMTLEKRFTRYHAGLLEALATQAAVAIENASLYEELKKSSEELERGSKDLRALLTVALDITSGLKLNDLMYRIARNATELTGADAGAVGLLDEKRGVVTYPFIYNLPEIISKVDVPIEGTMTGMVVSRKEPVSVEDYQQFPQRLPVFVEAGLRAMVMVPLLSRGIIIGALWVSSRDPDKRFDARDVMILEGIGRQASIALENARLYENIKKSTEEIRRRAKELTVLNGLSNVLSQTLELDVVLNSAIDSVMELFEADGTAIFLLDEQRNVLRLAVQRGLSRHLVEDSLLIPVGQRLPGVVAETGKPLIIENLAERPKFEAPIVYRTFKSLVGAPIKSKGRVIGTIPIGSHQVGKFTQHDATLLESIGSEIGIAIENSRLYETQRHISELLQRSMLPALIPSIPDMELGVRYSSATEEALVGGDFYDIFSVDGKYALLIGDVSGKGIEAATSTSMMKYILRAYLYQDPSPSLAMSKANDFFRRQEETAVFITVFCAVYDPRPGRLTFVNAGHPYPCLLNQIQKTCTVLSTDDPAIGIFDYYDYRENNVDMNPGNLFVAYTDGVIEARSGKNFFGEERLVETLLDNLGKPAQEIADSIIRATLSFSHGKLTDDIALLVLRKIG